MKKKLEGILDQVLTRQMFEDREIDMIISVFRNEIRKKLPKEIEYEFKGAGAFGWDGVNTIFFKEGWEKALSEVKEIIKNLE